MDQNELLDRLNTARRITVFSGAGLSVESGIPSFRDATDSLWANADPMAVASLEGFERDPGKVWEWHSEMRSLFNRVGPNAGHEAIARLEMLLQPEKFRVITQNIDGLHQEAGSSWVLEIHGTARRVRCHRKCGFIKHWNDEPPHACPVCGSQVRPDVVWFGEALDEMVFSLAEETAAEADVLFVVGSCSVIQPAASLPMLARNSGATLVEINPSETPLTEFANLSVRASASGFFTELCEQVASMRLH